MGEVGAKRRLQEQESVRQHESRMSIAGVTVAI